MAGVDPRELRDLVAELRADVGRVRPTIMTTGDHVEVIRERVDEVLVAVAKLAELEERRHEREQAAAAEELEESRSRLNERLESRRWWRVSVVERVALPAVSAALAFALARLESCDDRSDHVDPAAPATEAPADPPEQR